MSIDVVDLRNFYTQHLGVVARRFVGRGIRQRFATTRGMRVLGLGYATPYMGLFREEAERCLAFMPAAQGVVKWPTDRPALSTLVDELELPLPDAEMARILLVHALEMAHDPVALLREVWRVLAAGGRLLIVVPIGAAYGHGSIPLHLGMAVLIHARRSRSCCVKHGSPPRVGQRRCMCRRFRADGFYGPRAPGSALGQ